MSRPTIMLLLPLSLQQVVVYSNGKATQAAAQHGLASPRFVSAGSSTALEWTTSGSGAWVFDVQGAAPTSVGMVSAKAGSKATLRCPMGMRIVNLPHVSYGGDGCSSGGVQFLVEHLCLLKETCVIAADQQEIDPTNYTCRAVAVPDRVLEVSAECAAP